MHGTPLARVSLRWRLAIAAPIAACLALCLVARPELASLVAPFLGPWAGLAYAHSDCTMASVAPGWSVVLLAAGIVAGGAVLTVSSAGARSMVFAFLVAWSIAWSLLAALSLANTLS